MPPSPIILPILYPKALLASLALGKQEAGKMYPALQVTQKRYLELKPIYECAG